MNSQLFLHNTFTKVRKYLFWGFVLYFLKWVFEVSSIYLRDDSTPTSPAWGPSSRVSIWNFVSAYVAAKSPQQRLFRILTVNAKGFSPWASGLPSFWIKGDLPFFFFYFTFFRANLTFRLDLPASTRGQASEASWFPGMWVYRVCDSTVQMLIHYGK
jgi:hypothetical protein